MSVREFLLYNTLIQFLAPAILIVAMMVIMITGSKRAKRSIMHFYPVYEIMVWISLWAYVVIMNYVTLTVAYRVGNLYALSFTDVIHCSIWTSIFVVVFTTRWFISYRRYTLSKREYK